MRLRRNVSLLTVSFVSVTIVLYSVCAVNNLVEGELQLTAVEDIDKSWVVPYCLYY